MKNLNKTQLDYTAFGAAYQLSLPLDIEIIIPKNDPVRLLDAVISSLDLSCLFSTYERIGRIQYPPSILLKVLVYAYSKHIYSSRDIETACRENINFMFLLQNNPPPDHNTIARFRRDHLSFLSDEIQKKLTDLLIDLGEVSFSDSAVFIDG
ncbi:MAG: transposase, partial [Eubacteriaceae bacterium]|nr:transposase [Eubacteriaceae bacterium]